MSLSAVGMPLVATTPNGDSGSGASLGSHAMDAAASMDLLVEQVVAGDSTAWQALQTWAFPLLQRWTRSHPSMRRRRLNSLVDDVHEVATATLERLCADEFTNLRKYCALRSCDPQATLEAWLYGALDFTVREHLRARFGRFRGRKSEGQPVQLLALNKRDLNTLAPRLQEDVLTMRREALTSRLTWAQILSYVQAQFTSNDAQAIQHYVERNASYEELAEVLGLASADDAERLIRKLKERLRVHFRAEE
jgi:hypothetical protein